MSRNTPRYVANVLLTGLLFSSSVFPFFKDSFEAHALEPKDVKSISIDAAPAVPVKNVKVDSAGLLTAQKVTAPVPPIPPTPACKPLPSGFVVIEKQWSTLVGGTYPFSPAWLQPIGSWTERNSASSGGKPAAGKLYVSRFTADAGLHKIKWLGAQSVRDARYGMPQAADQVYVAISPCRGDVQAACSNRAKASSLFYGMRANAPGCVVKPGQDYYLIVGFFPRDLSATKNTCATDNASGGVLCDANFKVY